MASVRERKGKSGKAFMGLYRDGDGKQKSAGSYGTRKEALKAGQLAEAGIMPVKSQAVSPARVRGKVTVAAYAREWLPSHSLSPSTREVYGRTLEKHIIPAIGGRVVDGITAADIRQLFRSLEHDGTSRAMLAKVKTVMSSMFQAACEDRLCPANVVRGVKFQSVPPKRRRALSADEWLRVRKYLVGENRLFADIQMTTGARVEEIRAIETSDIKGSMWTISRVRSEILGEFTTVDRTKTGKARTVPMDPALAKRIKAGGPGRVFTDIRRETYRKHWRRACQAAGLDWYPAPRDLRRTFATLAREGGVALDVLRQQLGHTNLATTDGYLGAQAEASTEAMKAVQRVVTGTARA